MKLKARNIIAGWPRSRSTMAMFSGTRFLGRPLIPGAQYYRYVPLTSLTPSGAMGTTEVCKPNFQYTTEHALETEYRRGQQEMVDNFRAEYRRLTHEDLQWLVMPDKDLLREAMKSEFYRQYLADINAVPVTLVLTIKNAAANDKPLWYRFRATVWDTYNSVLFA